MTRTNRNVAIKWRNGLLLRNMLAKITKFRWSGFSPQLFLITVLPLTGLLLLVAFGSQMLHHEAMRALVGERDLRTVHVAAGAIEDALSYRAGMIQMVSRSLPASPDWESLTLKPDELSNVFNGGLARFAENGHLISTTQPALDWLNITGRLPGYFDAILKNEREPVFSSPVSLDEGEHTLILVGWPLAQQQILVGAFTAETLIEAVVKDLAAENKIVVMVVGPGRTLGSFEILYHSGSAKPDESTLSHSKIPEVLRGESGISYHPYSEGEHAIAFSPIAPVGWGLVIEEVWEDNSNPYLRATQTAPMVVIPAFLLALVVLWLGTRRIVQPLQALEKQAAQLAQGDFEAIQHPVGGIEAIRNLHGELVDMAVRLKAAQHSLHSYIGAITAGIENERRSLARELHDDTIQALIALNQRIQLAAMRASDSEKTLLAELQNLVQQTVTDLRRMIRGLRPIYLEDLGLVASLEMLARDMAQLADIPISFQMLGSEQRLSAQVEMSLYRMVQEALNNVVRHSQATRAWVELTFREAELTVAVRDDGKGFLVPGDPSEFPEKGHFGLLGMQERAEIISAQLTISSAPDAGTTIFIRVPVTK
jgi:signal transduction histidine kinase